MERQREPLDERLAPENACRLSFLRTNAFWNGTCWPRAQPAAPTHLSKLERRCRDVATGVSSVNQACVLTTLQDDGAACRFFDKYCWKLLKEALLPLAPSAFSKEPIPDTLTLIAIYLP